MLAAAFSAEAQQGAWRTSAPQPETRIVVPRGQIVLIIPERRRPYQATRRRAWNEHAWSERDRYPRRWRNDQARGPSDYGGRRTAERRPGSPYWQDRWTPREADQRSPYSTYARR